MRSAIVRLATAALCALVITSVAESQSGATDGQWRYYRADAGGTRYSSLEQVNRDNVQSLRVAWEWRSDNFGPEPELRGQTTPLMVDGVLYATAGITRNVVAIDAGTGQTLWMYRLDEGERGEQAPRRFSGRGVAYWKGSPDDERIYFVTVGYQLVALNARTGAPVTTFGRNGILDLMQDVEGEGDPVGRIGSSSPPVIVGDVVVAGPAFHPGFRPPTKENVRGDIHGYDVRSGRKLWTFHTIPRAGELGYDTWKSGADVSGNAGVWTPFTADLELGYLYLPVEAPTSDFYGGHRLGDNLFGSSLVCLDAKTGARVWHYQLVRHDVWDYDVGTPPILADIVVEGEPIRAVVQLTKQSMAFVFDRVTGKPVWPIEDVAVPASDVPGEVTAATQPFPSRPAAFDRQGVSIDDLIDFTPALRSEAQQIASRYRLGPIYQPPSVADGAGGTAGTLMLPGAVGGAAWESGAFDPQTQVLYVSSSTSPFVLSLVSDPEASNLRFIAGNMRVSGPQGLPLIKPPYGRITAIDLKTGEHLWMQPNGDTPEAIRNHPALTGIELPRTGSHSRAGILVTKTLVLAGQGWGGGHGFYAYDKQSGEILARFQLPGAQTGLPMTYLHRERQYIVMSVGAADPATPARLVALALPEKESLSGLE